VQRIRKGWDREQIASAQGAEADRYAHVDTDTTGHDGRGGLYPLNGLVNYPVFFCKKRSPGNFGESRSVRVGALWPLEERREG